MSTCRLCDGKYLVYKSRFGSRTGGKVWFIQIKGPMEEK